MAKCQVRKGEIAEWAWQPFGPDENPKGIFTLIGNHYRGFPVIKVSNSAKCAIQSGEVVSFVYQKRLYQTLPDGIYEVTFKA